ncbi:hypothetical protein C1645_773821 [Glomus cerebriforme]|uniref:HMG box domain-containing protein n=1 Tax=Glomus cerebriforme TaxID=658196 RepID=A0A397SV75_9GLOM|nr:hypothetical protein C1645_773821 [Glomus cerebriforme]
MTIQNDNFIYETPNKQKRNGPNGFIKYRTESWEKFKRENPHISTKRYSVIAAEQWRNFSDEQRNFYIKLSEEEKRKTTRKVAKRTKRSYNKKKRDKESNTQPIEIPTYEPLSTIYGYDEYIVTPELYLTPPPSPQLFYYDDIPVYYLNPFSELEFDFIFW